MQKRSWLFVVSCYAIMVNMLLLWRWRRVQTVNKDSIRFPIACLFETVFSLYYLYPWPGRITSSALARFTVRVCCVINSFSAAPRCRLLGDARPSKSVRLDSICCAHEWGNGEGFPATFSSFMSFPVSTFPWPCHWEDLNRPAPTASRLTRGQITDKMFFQCTHNKSTIRFLYPPTRPY